MIEMSQTLRQLMDELKKAQPETFYHSLRVKNLTAEMLYRMAQAGALLCQDQEVNAICKGALLHDIGKLRVQNVLLTKPSALLDGEMNHLRQHTWLGAEMVREELQGEEGAIVTNICRYHHERIDGSGYEGMSDIPLYVHVVALCDAFDALTSQRVYRQAATPAQALQILREGGSGKFHPALLDFLEQTVKRGEEEIPCVL